MRQQVPFERSYWALPEHLLAGAYPGDREPAVAHRKLCALVDCGIRFILNLMEPTERDHRGDLFIRYEPMLRAICRQRGVEVTVENMPIRDGGIPTLSIMRDILRKIGDNVASARPAYVHCWGGVGRTGLVVGCFLVSQGLPGDLALARLGALRTDDPIGRVSPETEEQRQFVRAWHSQAV
jgi:hypothetical protein